MKNEQLNQTLLQENDKEVDAGELKARQKYDRKNLRINGSSWFQKLFFTWVYPLLSFGSKYTVKLDMIPQLPEKYSTQTEFKRFTEIWSKIKRCEGEGWTLIKALVRMHLKEWIVLMLFMIVNVMFSCSAPLLTALNIRYISGNR